MSEPEASDALCERLRAETGDTILVSFSGGKDAVATWIQCRRYWSRVVPFYLDPCPGLEVTRDAIDYYEQAFGVPIHRYTHPETVRMLLRDLVFQAPEDAAELAAVVAPAVTLRDVEDDLRRIVGAPAALVAVGVRISDSMQRRASIRKTGVTSEKRQSCFPVWDWTIDRLTAEVRAAGMSLSSEYRLFGRSFDGVWSQYAAALPDGDYARLLALFPMAEADCRRAGVARHVAPAPRPQVAPLLRLPAPRPKRAGSLGLGLASGLGAGLGLSTPDPDPIEDSPHWVCTWFGSRAQKEAFLEASGLDDLGDKHADGETALARIEGREVREERPSFGATDYDAYRLQIGQNC